MNEHLTAVTTSSPPVSSRHETAAVCEAPGCNEPIHRQGTGRPARFCSPACRAAAHRADRPPERSWMVRLRRGQRSVIVAIGLRRPDADRLASQVAELLGLSPSWPQ